MRRLVLLSGMLSLTGCGGNSEDFSVDVAMTPSQAHGQLAALDGGFLLSALSLPAVTASASGTEQLSFVLPGEKDAGELILRLEEVGHNMTRIHVALDMPQALRVINGKPMVIVEAKAEAELKTELDAWAKAVTTGGYGSLDEVNLVLGALSLALRPDKIREIETGGDGGLASLIDQDAVTAMFEREGGGAPQEYARLDQPMDTGAASGEDVRPMDDAQGDMALGEDPTPDEPAAY